jgi:hypothetical protein
MTCDVFDYDVAFSFLARDEKVALRIAGILADRFKTFVYSEKQKLLAGKDGEQAFAEVFSKKARVVVIFYRANWGKTPWTRIEEDAIRNRAHDDGYDFTLWVPLEKIDKLPAWMPKNRLWFNFERYGDTGLIAVIEQLIQQRGGNTKPETLADRAARMQREVELGDARKALVEGYDMNSGRMVAARAQEVSDQLYAWSQTRPVSGLTANRQGSHALLLSIDRPGRPPICTTVVWTQPYTNHLGRDARIKATTYEGTPPWPGLFVMHDAQEIMQISFRPDLDTGHQLCWKADGQEAELSAEAVTEAIARFVMDVRARVAQPGG